MGDSQVEPICNHHHTDTDTHTHTHTHTGPACRGLTHPQDTEGRPAEEPGAHGRVRAAMGGSPAQGPCEHEQRRICVTCSHKAVPMVTLSLTDSNQLSISKMPVGYPRGSVVKSLPINIGNAGLIHGLGRCPGGGSGYPLQFSCLENLMHSGAWQATVHGVINVGDN